MRSSLLIATLATMAIATNARAGSMDPSIERLVLPPSTPGAANAPDNIAFSNLISELGFAMSSDAFHPARTTGFGGFALTIEGAYTKINEDGASTATNGQQTPYWQLGTRGPTDPNTKNFSVVNKNPDSILQVYSLKARKGLPLGFEISGSLGYLVDSSLFMLGADIRWAPFEGFRTGPGGFLPDISVGGSVRTTMGTDQFSLTTVGLDAELSKPIPIASTVSLTPWIGFQRLWIYGDSSVIDSTPNVDPIDQCGYTGPDPVTGQPSCTKGPGSSSDFNNDFTFARVRVQRNRGLVGMAFRYEMIHLAAQFLFDLTDPTSENQAFLNNTRQWTLSFEAGVFF
jgi:hypothetical protein